MTSVISTVAASLLAHHLPLSSTIHGIFSSMASLQQWPTLITQHTHDAAYYAGTGPHCDPCACCIIVAECLCLTAVCCPFLCPIVATSNYVDEETNEISVKNEPNAKVWAPLSKEIPSLIDQDDMLEEEDGI
jgi:hypothetical protein